MVGAFPRLEQFDADDLFMVGADYGWSKSMVGTFSWLEHLWLEHFHSWSSLILMNQIMVGADYGWSKSMVGAFSCLEHSEIPFPIYGWSIPDGKFGANFWLEQNPVWSILTMLQP